MAESRLEVGEVRRIDNDTVEFRVSKIYADSWERGYDLFDVATGLRLVSVATEIKRLNENIVEEVHTYRLRSGYYALLEIVKFYSVAQGTSAIAIPWISGPITSSFTYTVRASKLKYYIYPLIVRDGMVFIVDDLIVEGETSQIDEVYKTVKDLLGKWRNELPKYEAKFA
ncbi:MAG: hypothetical protein L7H04_05640, partial [Vulcanisaeta sp.]|nr:hypothetical protein [Vulcanisaeta sp.]